MSWVHKTDEVLRRNGYKPISLEETERGYQNKVVRAECKENTVAVKWFTESSDSAVPDLGRKSNRFIGGWYVQDQMMDLIDIPQPNILHATFSDEEYYYIMDNIEFSYSDELWSDDIYLLRLCQDIGKTLSEVHTITESDIGGIPGKENNPTNNMRSYIKEISNMIFHTSYSKYSDVLEDLKRRYTHIYNPRSKRLVHGDVTASNILSDENGLLVGIVDWEDSMYGDPIFDIAMFQAMVCDVFGIFAPWDIEELRNATEESYPYAINQERLQILRALVHLWATAKIDSSAMLSPWHRVSDRASLTRQEIHENRFNSAIRNIDTVTK